MLTIHVDYRLSETLPVCVKSALICLMAVRNAKCQQGSVVTE
jgi:hypothetical protein